MTHSLLFSVLPWPDLVGQAARIAVKPSHLLLVFFAVLLAILVAWITHVAIENPTRWVVSKLFDLATLIGRRFAVEPREATERLQPS